MTQTNRVITFRASALAAILAVAACGGSDGDKTAPVTSASPNGGDIRGEVTLTSNEPATVYYTMDGSEPTKDSTSGASPLTLQIDADVSLKFFGIDQAGNVEGVKTLAFGFHPFGPLPLVQLRAVANASAIDLTWDAPADAADVVIVRSTTAVTAVPADGASLAVGATHGGGTVVYAGSAAAFSDAGLAEGGYVYTGFARYASGAYSDGRFASAAVRGAATVGQISFDLDADTATVTQPGGATVAVANIVHDEGAGTLTFDVAVDSTSNSIVFAPKLVFGGLPQGSWGAGLGTVPAVIGTMTSMTDFEGQQALLLGPEAIASDATRTRTVQINGLGDVASPYAFDVSFHTARAVFTAPWCAYAGIGSVALFDASTTPAVRGFSAVSGYDNPTQNEDCRALRGATLSADGRYLYAGSRNGARVGKWDTTTGQEVGGVNLAVENGSGAASDIILDPSGKRIWVVLNDGMHTGANRSTVENYQSRMDGRTATVNATHIVEVDVATMTETRRVTVSQGNIVERGRRLAISRDGRWLAVAVGYPYPDGDAASESRVALINAEQLAIVDANPATPAADLIGMPETQRPSQCAFSWSGDKLVCNNSWEEDCDTLAVIDLTAASLSVTPIDADPRKGQTCNFKAMQFQPVANGDMWLIGDYDGLTRLRANNVVETLVPPALLGGGGGMYAQGSYIADEAPDQIVVVSYRGLSIYDTTTGALVDIVNFGGTSTYPHSVAVSPY